MKILQVINSLATGGAEKFIVETVCQLKKDGNEVEILVFDRSNSFFLDYIKDLGVKVRFTKSQFFLSPLNLFTFIRVLNCSQFEIIHTHLTYAQFWCAIASLFCFRDLKLITTEHSNNNNRRRNSLLKYLDRFIYSRYSKVICISYSVKRSLLDWLSLIETDKYIVIPNCVNVSSFKKHGGVLDRSSFKFNETDKIILMVGRMSDAKDQITLIKAFRYLPDNYKCMLVGDGFTFADVYESIQDHSRIIMLGNRSDIPKLMSCCDLYVQSSHWEGLPTTVLEAMAAGKIVLGSAVNGNIDIIPEEQLFEHMNEKQLADKIIKYTSFVDKDILDKQDSIVKMYDVKIICDLIIKQYD